MIENRNENTIKKTQFNRWNIIRKNSQTFDEDPKIKIKGHEISLKEYQNKNAEDCNIYEVLEKYNGNLKLTAEQLNEKHIYINEELTKIKSLPDALKVIEQGEKLWKELPSSIRKDFGNSVNNFIKNGNTYVNQKIKQYNATIEAKIQETIEHNKKTGEQNNG